MTASQDEMVEAMRSASEALTYLWNNMAQVDEDPGDANIILMATEETHADAFTNLLNDAREKLAAVLDKIDHVPG